MQRYAVLIELLDTNNDETHQITWQKQFGTNAQPEFKIDAAVKDIIKQYALFPESVYYPGIFSCIYTIRLIKNLGDGYGNKLYEKMGALPNDDLMGALGVFKAGIYEFIGGLNDESKLD